MDDTRGGPSTDGMVRVLRLEPGRESARVASTDDDPVSLAAEDLVLTINEACNVGQSLLRGQIVEVVDGPVVEWLRITVVSVLEGDEKSVVIGADHHWEHLSVGWSASPLTANVQEDGTVILVEVLVVVPVPLLVGALVVRIKVINLVLEVVRRVVLH